MRTIDKQILFAAIGGGLGAASLRGIVESIVTPHIPNLVANILSFGICIFIILKARYWYGW